MARLGFHMENKLGCHGALDPDCDFGSEAALKKEAV
jgi:hypothetical protein